ncbi:MAG: VCBS repeat-containing protein [Myxococcales bacterium]|nr:VCBS repeat-containing protein [Myxococcales bacterium]
MANPRHSPRLALAAVSAGAITVAVAIACGPGGFDGLTGGVRDAGAQGDATLPPELDVNLPAPRPIGPPSGTFLSSSRPSFRWELVDPLRGAFLELCKTRKCETVAKTFEVDARSFTLPEDLEPGVWFWRLRGKAARAFGQKASPAWEIVVRGPAATGASNASHGSIVDVNGDGFADIVAIASLPGDEDHDLVVYLGGAEGYGTKATQRLPLSGRAVAIAAGVDVNGDGFGDVVVSTPGFFSGPDGGPFLPPDAAPPIFIEVYRGSEKGLLLGPEQPGFFEVPELGSGLREAGDVNGDGYGDVVATSTSSSVILLGSANGLAGPVVSLASPPTYAPAPGRLGLGGFDIDGDGLSDVAVGSAMPSAPAAIFFGASAGVGPQSASVDMKEGSVYLTSALALAALDIDGDAKVDLAFTATDQNPIDGIGPPNAVCFLRGPAPLLVPGECVYGNPAKGFAQSITGFDLDGDKRDDLIFRGGSGVISFHVNEQGAFDQGPGFNFGADVSLTTVMPSRPGAGVWAAMSSSQLFVIEGAKVKGSPLSPPAGTTFARILR